LAGGAENGLPVFPCQTPHDPIPEPDEHPFRDHPVSGNDCCSLIGQGA